jgi:hypothetical protein
VYLSARVLPLYFRDDSIGLREMVWRSGHGNADPLRSNLARADSLALFSFRRAQVIGGNQVCILVTRRLRQLEQFLDRNFQFTGDPQRNFGIWHVRTCLDCIYRLAGDADPPRELGDRQATIAPNRLDTILYIVSHDYFLNCTTASLTSLLLLKHDYVLYK